MTDEWTNPEMVREMKRISAGQDRLEAKIDTALAGFVTRNEFTATVARFESDLKELKTSKPPWTAVAPIVISIILAAVVLIPLIANG